MAEQLVSVSPKVLKWARTSLGLNMSDVAQELGKDIQVLEDWENGKGAPTYAQLEKLAYTVYKRPLAIFFLDTPPEEPNVTIEFRSFLSGRSNRLDKDTHLAIRDAKAKQIYLTEFSDSRTDENTLSQLRVGLSTRRSIAKTAEEFRANLGVSEEVIRNTTKSEEALGIWRAALEEIGIFIFKRAFKEKNISGFCINHHRYPIIVLNNKTSFTRQIFTLLHEVSHIALDVNGVCTVDTAFVSTLAPADKRIEEHCDQFAAEVLVPSDSFLALATSPIDDFQLNKISKRYRVSPAVIARKAFDSRLIEKAEYSRLMSLYYPDNWREFKKSDEGKSTGDYYNTQLQYLSHRYVGEAFRKYANGSIAPTTLADYLGIKVSSIAPLETRVLMRGAA